MFMRANGLPHIIVRLSNGYGVPKTTASSKWYLLLNDLCKSAFMHGRVALRSHPAIPRDFIWLGDVAAAVEALLNRADLAGQVFNLSSGTALGLGEVARRVAAGAALFFNKDIPLEMEQANAPCTGNPVLHVDNSAVRAALNITFHDRMDEEIHALLSVLSNGQVSGLP